MSGEAVAKPGFEIKNVKSKAPVSFFEFWPNWLFYAPVILFWAFKAIRYRSITLPTLANPRINAGGLCGESKNAILGLAGANARPWIADYVGLTVSAHVDSDDTPRALNAMEHAGLSFPVVIKPDMSCNGVGVKVVRDQAQLRAYLTAFPRGAELQLQRLVTYEGEAGIFYIRHPGEKTGKITSITLKYPPVVIGDGRLDIKALIEADERLNAISHVLLPKLGAKAATIPAAGERVALVFVGNHCRGSTFKDGLADATPALNACIDKIMQDMPEVYFSRIDLRYDTLDALREGRDFKIIEFNGAGSEATHIWDPEMTLRRAYKDQFFHYGESFKIGAQIRKSGAKPLGPWKLLALWQSQKKLMRAYPLND